MAGHFVREFRFDPVEGGIQITAKAASARGTKFAVGDRVVMRDVKNKRASRDTVVEALLVLGAPPIVS